MTKKELLARIEELERKVAELERERKPVIYVPWQQPQEPFQPYRWISVGDRTAPAPQLWGHTTSGG